MFAVASLLLATSSCSSEEELIPSGKNEGVEVNFQLALDDGSSSRAADHDVKDDDYGKGKRVNNVIAAVYSGGQEIKSLRQSENEIDQTDLTCKVTFRLIEGQTYDFVFWAERTGTGYYDTEDLTAIKVNYKDETNKDFKANDEDRDAFTAVRKGLTIKNGGMQENIVLTRPFAQLNIASTDADHDIAEAAGFGCDVLSSKVIIKGLYDTYNAYTETPTGSVDVVFDLAKVPASANEVLKNVKGKTDAEGKNYVGYLAMNYFLADKDQSQNVDVVARFKSSQSTVPVEISVPNVPVQRNYRTNIIGNILTEQAVFNIIIDPNFKEPDYIVGWDGETKTEVTPNAEGVYEIYSSSQLAWIAQEVNNGTSFEGSTVKLMEDINLGGQMWTPIGNDKGKPFGGIFDGNGKTIRNYSVNANEYAGLFGAIGHEATIKDVTVADATITGHHFGGALAGWVQSTDSNHTINIDNCHAKNVTVTLTPDTNKDNGNHAGGLIGYTVRTEITNCSADNVTVTAYRDCGGLIGCANDNTKGDNLSVTNSTITADQTVDYIESGKAANAGEVAGRLGAPVSFDSTSNNVEVIVKRNLIDASATTLSTGYYVLEAKMITAETGSALTIEENATVTLEVKGDVFLIGAEGGHGIDVPESATLNIVGGGALTVIGGNGEDSDNGGSGINGSVTIDGLSSLTAKGYGKNGYGIGSANATVTISNTKNIVAQGGYVQPNLINDTEYGKNEPEGAPAIGGAKITLDNVEVTKIDGGSKAAGIGARYWQSTDITIKNSTIEEVNGGNASAGIGGSRYSGGITAENKQIVKIKIENSTVTANGGEYGAGIGAGYDTHCKASEDNAVNDIQIVKSVITAQGGKYAAGIGTGYHSAALTGSIDSASTIHAEAGYENFYKAEYTTAQAIGYGVIDPTREGNEELHGFKVTFKMNGEVIEAPKAQK